MMVHFRKRIGPDLIKICNDMTKASGIALVRQLQSSLADECTEGENKELAAIELDLGERPLSHDTSENWGTLMLDAACGPDDIRYPVDLRLVNVGEAFSGGVAV